MYIWTIKHVWLVRPYQDTAVKIDSSDEEEEALNDTGSAMNSLEHCQSNLQFPVKRYPKF